MKIKLTRGRLPAQAPSEIDVTVRSALPKWRGFAPTWDLVQASKRGELTPAEYTGHYKFILDRRFRAGELPVMALYEHGLETEGPLVLCCYCPMDSWCHTHELVEWLVDGWPHLFEDGRPR